ncbi:MAG: hypothetical protein CMI31_12600 [Opitutae bacterium]|nr:hypothetical protein [Opitutae bacterium]
MPQDQFREILPKKETPKRVELKDLLRVRDLVSIEAALLTSPIGFRSTYPPRQVNSVYFDSHDFRAIDHSLSGSSIRQKARLRWYGEIEDANQPTLELKCKQGHLSWKILRSTKLSINPNASDWATAFRNEDGDCAISTIRNLLPVTHHRPTTLVSYTRKYYESYDGRIRVTLDEDLAFRDQALVSRPNFHCVRLHPEKLVLEIKLAEENLSILRDLAKTLPFVPQRFSKYCEALIGHLTHWQ